MYPQIFGKYLLEREIAQGGMAVVHLATLRGAEGFEKRLVVKQIREDYAQDRDFIERFVREAKTNVSLNHPNIVTIYELGIERGTYFIAMEYIEGASISEILRASDGQRLSPRAGAFIGAELLRALDYAHRKMQVIHRDVTPRNVVIDEEGQVKLIDFGIAARARGTKRETFGSPGHMAPEQIEGGELGPPTDLFAVATLLLEIWSGVAPFRRTTEEECRTAIFSNERPKPSSFDPSFEELDDIVLRALAIDAKERPTLGELEDALRKYVAKSEPSSIARELGGAAQKARAITMARASGEDVHIPDAGESRTFATRASLAKLTDASGRDSDDAPPSDGSASSDAVVVSTRKIEPRASSADDIAAEESKKTTAIDAPSTASSGADASKPTPFPRAAVAIAVALLGAVLVGWRALQGSASGTIAANTAPTNTGPSPAIPSMSAPFAASSSPDASVALKAEGPLLPVPSATARPSSSASSAHVERVIGRIRFVGDPGTSVFVDGRKRGALPKDVDVPAGAHEIRLLFEPTGESHGELLQVGSGEHLLLRSSFSGARPVVHVIRENP